MTEYYRGTLEELYPIERTLREELNIPDGLGTVRFVMSLPEDGEEVLPRETTTPGVYAFSIPVNGWQRYTHDEIATLIELTPTQDVEFPEGQGV